MLQNLGYGAAPEEPPEPLSEAEIDERVARHRDNLMSHWQWSLDYLGAVCWPAVHFRIANGARSFLNNVQVIITFEDVEGVEKDYPELFRFEKLEDPDWREPDPYGINAMRHLRPTDLQPREYPIRTRNVEGNLRVRITLPELRPTPPWDTEEEEYEDVVLILREPSLEKVAVSYTVTADTYGEAFEDSLTVPVERVSALDLLQFAWRAQQDT